LYDKESDMDEKRDVRRGGLVGPVILIGLGVVFLLNNLGILSWSMWDVIFRLWPVLLIAAGLDIIIGRRSAWGSLLALALTLIVLAGALWLFGAYARTGQAGLGEEIRQTLDGATEAEVVIAHSVGTLRVESLLASRAESANLIEGTIRPGRGEKVARDFAIEGEKATFTLRSEGVSVGPFPGGWGGQWTWNLGLNSDIPLDLEISLGVGQSDVDLRDLMVSELDMDMGIGQTTVTLPEEGRFWARIDGAIGQTTIRIPEGLAVRVHVDTGLAARQLPHNYRCRDDVCTSPGYESAEDRVDLDVSQAIGNVAVRQIEAR
jgi:hypothetical protein